MGGRVPFASRALIWAVALSGMALSHASPPQPLAAQALLLKPVRLLTEASSLGEPIARLEPGLKLSVITYSTNEDWVEVRTPGGRTGWIPVRFTNLAGRRAEDVLSLNSSDAADSAGGASHARQPASISNRGLAQSDDLSGLPTVSTEGDAPDGPSDATEVEDVPASESMPAQGAVVVPANSAVAPTSATATAESSAAATARAEQAPPPPRRQLPARREAQPQSPKPRAAQAGANTDAQDMDRSFRTDKRKGAAPVTVPATIWPWEILAGLDFAYQLTPETMPGFDLRAAVLYALDERWSIGGGLEYMYATTSASDASIGAEVSKNFSRFTPYAAGRFRQGRLQVLGTLGFSYQSTSITTTDTTTGATITTGDNGLLVTGSGTSYGLSLRLSPAYMFRLSDKVSLGPALSYVLDYEFSSGGGAFEGESSSSLFHAVTIGAVLTMGF